MEKVEEIDGEMSVALLDMSVPNPTVHVKFHFCCYDNEDQDYIVDPTHLEISF